MVRAPSARRGPGRTSVSPCSVLKRHTRCARMARMPDQPGRCSSPSEWPSPTMMRSGSARTTYSGFNCGNGPMRAGTMFLTPRRARVSPINDASPAAYIPTLASKYTRADCTEGGNDRAAAATSASMERHRADASGKPSKTPSWLMTRCTSAWFLGSSATTLSPNCCRRSCERALAAITTTSGRSATMASILGSKPPPTVASGRTLSGKLESLSTPTRRAHWPSAQMVSVSAGIRLMMRWGGCANVTTTARSSVICTARATAALPRSKRATTINQRQTAMKNVAACACLAGVTGIFNAESIAV